MSEEDGMRLHPFYSKKERYFSRISAVVRYFMVVVLPLSLKNAPQECESVRFHVVNSAKRRYFFSSFPRRRSLILRLF